MDQFYKMTINHDNLLNHDSILVYDIKYEAFYILLFAERLSKFDAEFHNYVFSSFYVYAGRTKLLNLKRAHKYL